ncbi:hypothetical protein GOP96_06305 [Vibrio cholerae]|nr:hypothetical protein [Vibrio cholerae]
MRAVTEKEKELFYFWLEKCAYCILILIFIVLISLPLTGLSKNKQPPFEELSTYSALFEQCLTQSNGNKLQCLSYLKATTSDATYDAILSKLAGGNATEDKPIGF